MRRTRVFFLTVLSGALSGLLPGGARAQDDYWADELRVGHDSLRRGKLAEATEVFEDILAAVAEEVGDDRPDATTIRLARQGLLEIDLTRGAYDEVRRAIDALPPAERRDRGYRVQLARACERRGDHARARTIWGVLRDEIPGDAFVGYRYGRLLREIGEAEQAREVWRAVVEGRTGGLPEDPVELAYMGRCLVELGGRDNIEQASELLLRSIKAGPDRAEARTALGLLYFSVYSESANHQSGETYLKKVVRENGEVEEALLGLYRIRRANFQKDPRETEEYLGRVLSLNPHCVPALMERGIVLLQDRRFEDAAQVFDRALEINPNDKWVLAHRAATALLMHDPELEQELRQRALDVDGGFCAFDTVIGDHLVALYRFEDAVPFYRRALAEGPETVATLHGLAKALIYTGAGGEAVSVLRRAVELEPGFVRPWRDNALAVEDLLAEQYRSIEGEEFVFVLHEDDQEVLAEYFEPAHLEARQVLGAKYGHMPAEPVRVEVFHTWDDFSVRTIGFRGFSALGACFGRFITLVSPVDDLLRQQDFMWAATVWHEYTHVLTLALSDHRVPRWLTEGFSVYEERQRNRAWERGMDRDLFNAYHNGEVVPVRQLNSLFRGSRILFGYYQGGLIVEYLSREFGFPKVVELLRGYAEDRSTEDLFGSVFGLSTAEFDRRFLEFVLEEKLRGLRLVPGYSEKSIQRLLDRIAAQPDDLEARVALGWAYVQRDNLIDAGDQVRIVLGQEPEHPQGLLLHAEMLLRRGAHAEAEAAFRQGFAAGGDDFDSRVRFGKLLANRGDVDDAIDQFQRAKACWPQCTDQRVAPNLLLARLLRGAGRETEGMMELKSYVQRTGRAFQPRLELAAMEEEQGNREEEARLLLEAVWIDPFMRELHVRLGDAYAELGRVEEALREYRVALAVPAALDRAHLGKPAAEIPDAGATVEREARARICLRLAKLHHRQGASDDARHFLDRVETEVPDSDLAGEARELRLRWLR